MPSITTEQVQFYRTEVEKYASLDSCGEFSTLNERDKEIDTFCLGIIKRFGPTNAMKIIPCEPPTGDYVAFQDKIYVNLWSYCVRGVIIIRNPGKGNCGYMAFASQTESIGYKTGHKTVRKNGVNWGKENTDTLALWPQSVPTYRKSDTAIIQYLNMNLEDKVYIDGTMFNILACAYKRQIEIYKFKYQVRNLCLIIKYRLHLRSTSANEHHILC